MYIRHIVSLPIPLPKENNTVAIKRDSEKETEMDSPSRQAFEHSSEGPVKEKTIQPKTGQRNKIRKQSLP